MGKGLAFLNMSILEALSLPTLETRPGFLANSLISSLSCTKSIYKMTFSQSMLIVTQWNARQVIL